MEDGRLIERYFRHNNNKSASVKKKNPNPIKKRQNPNEKLRGLINSDSHTPVQEPLTAIAIVYSGG
jgi:hypothetical protein